MHKLPLLGCRRTTDGERTLPWKGGPRPFAGCVSHGLSSTRSLPSRLRRPVLGLLSVLLLVSFGWAQAHFETGTGLGVEKVRLAVADFKASTSDPNNAGLLTVFNSTLWNDLDNAGIFDMVSKSFYPLGAVGAPADVKFEGWSSPPPNA